MKKVLIVVIAGIGFMTGCELMPEEPEIDSLLDPAMEELWSTNFFPTADHEGFEDKE